DVYDGYKRNYDEMMAPGMVLDAGAPSFEEKAFHDFHMYTLDQKVSFANNQTKQLELYPLQNIKASQSYEYSTWDSGVNSVIKFKNTEENGIGKPLPKGTVKVYKQDSDGNLEFIGEDSISHTSKNEEVKINTGTAFDLVASTLVRDHKDLGSRRSERTIQVTLRNNSAEAKTINVLHQLGGNDRITESNFSHTEDTNMKSTFEVPIQSDKEVILSFTVRTEY
ncbi:MAG TPA: DUF4139 domain-containing protein, partial [Candidatus Syntrophosphaera sp.]|nr:DUF4139 domain-containing protein [Candidatus Syntrophosphaera sp.]